MKGNDAIALIKQRINIVDLINRFVPLKQVGSRFVAPCPFHQETKPSFSVNPDGFFYCFGCQKSGDIFDFWMEYHGVTFKDALEQLAREAGVTLDDVQNNPGAARKMREQRTKRQQLMAMYKLAQSHFQKNLFSTQGAACRAYMQGRGISPELLERFGLGWAMDGWRDLTTFLQRSGCNLDLAMEGGLLGKSSKSGRPYDPFRARLMFPIRNTAGETIAFGGRIIDNTIDAAKYVNSQDSPIYKKGEHLYGLDLAGKAIRVKKQVFITEGYMDVLTLHQFGYTNAVGGLGTALTDQQVQRILGYSAQVMLLYDGDNAGRKAALAAAGKFLARGVTTKVILQPEGEDIDSLLRTQGPAAFDTLCANSVPALRFCVDCMRERSPREAVHWARDFIRSIQISELISPAITYLARGLGLDEVELRRGAKEELAQQHAGSVARDPNSRTNAPAAAIGTREREILRCAVRYPERMDQLKDMGADMLLKAPFALRLWNKLEATPSDAAGYGLVGEERAFWDRYRGMEAPPRTTPDVEIGALKNELDSYYSSVQKLSLSAVLRQNDDTGDFGAGMEYLGVLQETLAGKDNEQS